MDMDRLRNLQVLYTQPKDPRLMYYDNLLPPFRIFDVLTPYDVNQLNQIAKDKKLSAKPKEKINMIKNIMYTRGFKTLASGTNRIVFKFMENQSVVVKVAFDEVGLGDSWKEMYNQNFIKPWCTKVFEVSPCGTVGLFERVTPITNRQQFMSIAEDVYDIIINNLVGRYVLNDFGTKYFMNWGVRKGFHPVILDFPYMYELDGAKIYCNRPDHSSPQGFCGGEIDYDAGFNHLVCTKCGKTYLAAELKLSEDSKNPSLIIEKKEDITMKVEIKRGDGKVFVSGNENETSTYKRRKETPLEYRERHRVLGFHVDVTPSRTIVVDDDSDEEEEIKSNISSLIDAGHNDPNFYNSNWGMDALPKVNDMFKNMEVVCTPSQKKPKQPKPQKPVQEKEAKKPTVSVVEPEPRVKVVDIDFSDLRKKNTVSTESIEESKEEPMVQEITTVNKVDLMEIAKDMLEIVVDDDQVEVNDEEPTTVSEIFPELDIPDEDVIPYEDSDEYNMIHAAEPAQTESVGLTEDY